jgi:hypothetical protein
MLQIVIDLFQITHHLIREYQDMLGVSPEAVFSDPLNQTAQAFQTLTRMSNLSNTVFC